MRARSQRPRIAVDAFVKAVSAASAVVGIFFLLWIIWEVVAKGVQALDWAFFTESSATAMTEGGGMANGILGTMQMMLLAVAIGVPVGLLTGVFLSEFGRGSRLAFASRYLCNALMGTPSIIVGVFVYVVLVQPMGHASGYAGGLALAVIMLPVVARTAEDILRLVPYELRESALALGAPHWRMVLGIVFRAAKSGLLTAVLLAVARVSGETAPLLFTAMNNEFFSNMNEPMANLTVSIYQNAFTPYRNLQQDAWGGALLITAGVLLLTVTARALFERRKSGRG